MNKKIVINSCNGGYFVTIDDRGLPWVYRDTNKMLDKIKKELKNEPKTVIDVPDWVKEELEKV